MSNEIKVSRHDYIKGGIRRFKKSARLAKQKIEPEHLKEAERRLGMIYDANVKAAKEGREFRNATELKAMSEFSKKIDEAGIDIKKTPAVVIKLQ